jgi:hypothetical protein
MNNEHGPFGDVLVEAGTNLLDKLSHYKETIYLAVIYNSFKPCCIHRSTILYLDRLNWTAGVQLHRFHLMVKVMYRSSTLSMSPFGDWSCRDTGEKEDRPMV